MKAEAHFSSGLGIGVTINVEPKTQNEAFKLFKFAEEILSRFGVALTKEQYAAADKGVFAQKLPK